MYTTGLERVHELAARLGNPACHVTANKAGEFRMILLGQGDEVSARETAVGIEAGYVFPVGIIGMCDGQIQWAIYDHAPWQTMINAAICFATHQALTNSEPDFLEWLYTLEDPRDQV